MGKGNRRGNMKNKKILCICENGGLADRYYVKYLKKILGDSLEIATETKAPIIQKYDYAIMFEPPRVKLNHLLNYIRVLPKNTKKIWFSQDPHLPSVLNLHEQILDTLPFKAVITTQKDKIKHFEDLGYPTLYSTWALDPDVIKNINLTKQYDIGIAGTMNPTLHPIRKFLIEKIKEKFSVFPIQECKEEDISKVYSSCWIGFNYSIENDVNLRMFEIIGTETLLLTDDKPLDNGLKDILTLNEDFIAYEDVLKDTQEESEKQVQKMLNLIEKTLKDKDNIKKMALKAKEKVLKNHLFEHRAKEIVSFLYKL